MSEGPTDLGEPLHDGRLGVVLANLGSWCWDHARTILLVWVFASILGGVVAVGLSERLLSGSGDIAGSASLRVDRSLREDFGARDSQSLLLVFRSPGLDARPSELRNLMDRLNARLASQPLVAKTTGETGLGNPRLAPKPGSGHLILIELGTADVLATEQQVPKLRAAIAPLLVEAQQQHTDLDWAITGRAALTHDLNIFSAEDSARSEVRALPVTLLILLFAFGSVAAAILPLLLALITRSVALGAIFLVADSVEVSNLVQSIVTMLALALGIDYSLFLIHRYRREQRESETADGQLAMRRAMAQSGTAIFYSAATVAIGIGALLATPLMQTRSIGVGGLLGVLVSLLASLTLVPAILRLLGPHRLEWPGFISRRIDGQRSHRLWTRWAELVVQRPWLAILSSLALLAALASPALSTRFGFPEGEFLPPQLEYARGMAMLDKMELKGLVAPVLVVVRDRRGASALSPTRLETLEGFVTRLEEDPRVGLVLGPVRSSAAPTPATMEEAMGNVLARELFVSPDRSALLFRVIPSGNSSLAELRALANDIPSLLGEPSLQVEVGGQAQYYNDFDRAVGHSYQFTLALVMGMSTLILLLFFRAPLASAKAIVLNLFSVAAGYGMVVLVFQLGYGAPLFGQATGTGAVPITVPLVIFCILFGLSMDYEIFLLSRVRSVFLATGDNLRSIREGLADTGAIITSAALIMVAVFGAFAFARVVIVQMIGLGLAVAVLVDATVIRSLLGPALMQVAGRWNWWPLQAQARQNRRGSSHS